MIDERTEELAAAYVLGALDPEEIKQVERQLQSDAELQQLVAELRGVTELVGGTSPAVEPSVGLRARLQVELEEGDSSRRAPVSATRAG